MVRGPTKLPLIINELQKPQIHNLLKINRDAMVQGPQQLPIMPLFKKKLRDTKLAKFLKDKAPDILDGISDILPDKGLLGIAGNIIDRINKSDKLTPEDKEMALKLLEMDKAEMENITTRWQADMLSDSWLSKNVRPIVLLYFCFLITILLIFAACKITMPAEYVYMIKEISMIVIVSYYGSRGIEKYNEIRVKRGK